MRVMRTLEPHIYIYVMSRKYPHTRSFCKEEGRRSIQDYILNCKWFRYGRSLGSGPTTHLAAALSSLKQIVAGVILQSPVLSMYRVVFQFRFSMPGDLFCNIDRIADIESPITIIHGTRDEVVPFWHAEILFETCQQEWRFKPLWVTDAGHNNIEVFLRFAITNFSSRVVLTQNFILY